MGKMERAMTALLCLGIALRFVSLFTPLSGLMTERQADTAAITRNFLTEEFNPVHPRIDWRGTTSGYVESELQLYTVAVASITRLSSLPIETAGRLVSIAFFLAGVFYFHRLVERKASSATARIASAILVLFPAYTYFSRVMMPDSCMLAFAAAGVYYFDVWISSPRRGSMILWMSLLSIAILIKPYMAHLALPMLIVFVRKRRCTRIPLFPLLIAGVVWSVLIAAFFLHAHSLAQSTGLSFGIFDPGTGKWLNPALYSFSFFKKMVVTRLFLQHANWALLVALFGVAATWNLERASMFRWWFGSVLMFILIVNHGNFVHVHYQLPATFAIAYFAAEGCAALRDSASRLRRAMFPVFFAAFLMTSMAATALFMATEHLDAGSLQRVFPARLRSFAAIDPEIFSADELARIGAMVSRSATRQDLLVVAGKTAPALLYACDRKGWRYPIAALNDSLLARRRSEGAVFLMVNARDSDASRELNIALRRLSFLFAVDEVCGVHFYGLR
jgi:hypothetical protein